MSNIVQPRQFVARLRECGVDIPQNTRRIIIDVQPSALVKIYYDTFAAPTLLQAITPEFLMNGDKIEHSDQREPQVMPENQEDIQ